MNTFFRHILILALLTSTAFAEPAVAPGEFHWPSSNTPFRIGTVTIPCEWISGRPWAARHDLVKLLHIADSGSDPADLIEALTEKGWTVRRGRDGFIEAINPHLAAAVSRAPTLVKESDESLRALNNFRVLLAQNNLVWLVNDPRAKMVNDVGQAVAQQVHRAVPWTFAIIGSSEPNAACTVEGLVFITTGLLDMLSRDELAGVLAHEVAHGARQNLAEDRNEERRRAATEEEASKVEATYQAAREAAERQYQIDRQRRIIKADESRDNTLATEKRVYERSMDDINARRKSHQTYANFKPQADERQADLMGLKYALQAGFQRDGLLLALEKLQASNFTNYQMTNQLGSRTHPPIAARIKALRAILARP